MENVLCAKFHFEVKYTHIMDFSLVGRSIIAPFLKLASGFNILNEGTLEEAIRLEFADSKFTAEFRWDRAFIISQGDITRFGEETHSVNSTFFQIINKLKELPSFGQFMNYVSLTFFIKVTNDSQEDILSKYKSEYLTSKVNYILKGSIADVSIILEHGDPRTPKYENVTLGPYSSNKDYELHNLEPFKNSELSVLRNPNTIGKMVKIQLSEDATGFNFKMFKTAILQINSYSKLLNE